MKTCLGNVVGLAVVGVLLAACGGKEQSQGPTQAGASKPSIAALSKAAGTNATGQTPTAAPPPPGTPAPPGSVSAPASDVRGVVLNEDGVEIGLAQIHAALKVFTRDVERFPNSFEEMVKFGVIPRIPPPPAGKKYILDAKAKTALMVDK